MSTMVIVSYYGLRDALGCAAKNLEKLDWTVINWSAFRWSKDCNDARPDWKSQFLDFIRNINPDVILWWYFGMSYEDMKGIVSECPESTMQVMYNWDDPFSWMCPNNQMSDRAHLLDLAFTSCKQSCESYTSNGTKVAVHLLPGFDPWIHCSEYVSEEVTFEYDVSLCCTNLYETEEYRHQLVKRKDLIDAFVQAQDLKFRLFGPESFRAAYPTVYGGNAKYSETAEIFRQSRVNLCTHVVSDWAGYLNERAVLITGTGGGILLTDNIRGLDSLLEPGVDCLTYNSVSEAVQIVRNLKNETGNKKFLRMSQEAMRRAWDRWTWERWAGRVSTEIKSFRGSRLSNVPEGFNHDVYKLVFYPNETLDREALWRFAEKAGSVRCWISLPPEIQEKQNIESPGIKSSESSSAHCGTSYEPDVMRLVCALDDVYKCGSEPRFRSLERLVNVSSACLQCSLYTAMSIWKDSFLLKPMILTK